MTKKQVDESFQSFEKSLRALYKCEEKLSNTADECASKLYDLYLKLRVNDDENAV
jgi:hypothetical protein